MDNESSCYCPSCGWPTFQAYELVSRHQTSEGEVVYSRCPCGRMRIWQSSAGTAAVSSRAAASEPPLSVVARSRSRSWRLLGILGLSVGIAIALVVALTLPTTVVLACLGLGVVIGGMAGVWTWLTTGASWSATLRFAVCAAVLGGIAGFVLAGFALVFGAASVTLLPVAYVVIAVLGWLVHTPRGRPC